MNSYGSVWIFSDPRIRMNHTDPYEMQRRLMRTTQKKLWGARRTMGTSSSWCLQYFRIGRHQSALARNQAGRQEVVNHFCLPPELGLMHGAHPDRAWLVALSLCSSSTIASSSSACACLAQASCMHTSADMQFPVWSFASVCGAASMPIGL